jgi:hypothetical protein
LIDRGRWVTAHVHHRPFTIHRSIFISSFSRSARQGEGALFTVTMPAGTRGGSTDTCEDIEAGLTAAGFVGIRQIQSKAMFSLVEGCKP